MTVSFHIWPLHLKVMVKESLWDKCDKLSFCCRRPGGASLQAGAEGAAVLCPKLVGSSLRIHALQELYHYSAGSQGAGAASDVAQRCWEGHRNSGLAHTWP